MTQLNQRKGIAPSQPLPFFTWFLSLINFLNNEFLLIKVDS